MESYIFSDAKYFKSVFDNLNDRVSSKVVQNVKYGHFQKLELEERAGF